jgi:hypothetical protein
MTYTDAQHLLAFLKLYTGQCDGIWGKMSRAAMTEFQTKFGGIAVTGEVNEESGKALRHAVAYWYDEAATDNNVGGTDDIWANSEFFTREEFRCQCGGRYCNGFPVEPELELVRVCNEIRRRLGVPVTIVESGGSGVRCAQHNANVKGAKNSNHLYGKAADLHSDKSPQEMYRVADEVLGNTGELGLYSWGIHVAVNCDYSRFRG